MHEPRNGLARPSFPSPPGHDPHPGTVHRGVTGSLSLHPVTDLVEGGTNTREGFVQHWNKQVSNPMLRIVAALPL